MTTVAIEFREENSQKILMTEAIDPDRFAEGMKKFGPDSAHARLVYGQYYFIPQGGMIDLGGKVYDTWTIICAELFAEKWIITDPSPEKIQTDFVEIQYYKNL